MTRREALASSSPPLRHLLLGLAAATVIFGGSLAWNVIDICKRRDEWPLG